MTALSELADVKPPRAASRRPPDGDVVDFIGLADIDAATATALPRSMRFADVPSGAEPIHEGDLLLARIEPSLANGKLAVAHELRGGVGLASPELVVLRPHAGVPVEWLRAFLRRDRTRAELGRHTAGSAGQQRLPPRVLRTLRIRPLPSPAELMRVVEVQSALDELAAGLVVGRERLERLSGALCQDRARGRPREPFADSGLRASTGTARQTDDGAKRPLVRARHLMDGRLSVDAIETVAVETRGGPRLRRGDLLLGRLWGADRPLPAAVFEGPPGTVVASSVLHVHRGPDASILPELLWGWLRTPEARSRLQRSIHVVAGAQQLSSQALSELPLPRFSPHERELLVDALRELRALLALADAQLDVLARLRQAHLDTTFGAVAAQLERHSPETAPISDEPLLSVFEQLSARQREVWGCAAELAQPSFTLDDLLGDDGDRERTRRAVRVLVRLGVIMHDSHGEAATLRRYERDLDGIEATD